MGLIQLHSHSEYSFLSSTLTIPELVSFYADQGFRACALTDTLSTYGFYQWTKLSEKKGIKPVYGIELFVRGVSGKGRYPIVLIALHNQGLKNLFKLNHLSHQNYKTAGTFTLPFDILTEHHDGLAILVEAEILHHKEIISSTYKTIERYQELFQDNFFIEMNYTGEKKVPLLKEMVQIVESYGLQALATSEARYPTHDKKAFDYLLELRQKNYGEDERGRPIDPSFDYTLKTRDEWLVHFKNHPQYLQNAERLLERIDARLDDQGLKVPVHHEKQGSLKNLLDKKLTRKTKDQSQKTALIYEKRLSNELKDLELCGQKDLIYWLVELHRFLKHREIPHDFSRGRVSASLVVNLLGITRLDPVAEGLYYRQFIACGAVLPDIVLDICWKRKDELYRYLESKYSPQNAVHAADIVRLKPKTLIKQLSRLFKLNREKYNQLMGFVSLSKNIPLEDLLKSDARFFALYVRDPEIHELLNIALRLEGLASHANSSSNTIVVIPGGAMNNATIGYSRRGEAFVHLCEQDLEDSTFLRIKLNGMRFLTILSDSQKRTAQQVNYHDKSVYELIGRGATVGIYHLEYAGIRDSLRACKPSDQNELTALIALYRPGPIQKGLLEFFVKQKTVSTATTPTLDEDKRLAEIRDPFTAKTNGILLYQEQVLKLLLELGKLTWEQAERFYKALIRHKNNILLEMKDKFVEGCLENALSPEEAVQVFGWILSYGGDTISTAGALVNSRFAYEGAFYKAYYPVEFYLSLLNNNIGDVSRLNRYLMDLRYYFKDAPFEILPVDINQSGLLFKRQKNGIRGGLYLVKFVSASFARAIVRERKLHGAYKDIMDFAARLKDQGLTSKALEFLVKAGAFDFNGINRKRLLTLVHDIIRHLAKISRNYESGLFQLEEVLPNIDFFMKTHVDEPKDSLDELFRLEYEATDLYLTRHPLDRIRDSLKNYNVDQVEDLGQLNYAVIIGFVVRLMVVQTKNGRTMATAQVADDTGLADAVIFPSVYQQYGSILHQGKIYLLKGKVSGQKILIEQIFLFDEAAR